jgi:arabinan endo-1,5-alpha-L-arabinosidase
MMDGGGTALLQSSRRWIGPGGESVLKQKDGDIIVFHAYDSVNGQPYLQISTIAWTHGWPKIALEGEDTTATSGESGRSGQHEDKVKSGSANDTGRAAH